MDLVCLGKKVSNLRQAKELLSTLKQSVQSRTVRAHREELTARDALHTIANLDRILCLFGLGGADTTDILQEAQQLVAEAEQNSSGHEKSVTKALTSHHGGRFLLFCALGDVVKQVEDECGEIEFKDQTVEFKGEKFHQAEEFKTRRQYVASTRFCEFSHTDEDGQDWFTMWCKGCEKAAPQRRTDILATFEDKKERASEEKSLDAAKTET